MFCWTVLNRAIHKVICWIAVLIVVIIVTHINVYDLFLSNNNDEEVVHYFELMHFTDETKMQKNQVHYLKVQYIIVIFFKKITYLLK